MEVHRYHYCIFCSAKFKDESKLRIHKDQTHPYHDRIILPTDPRMIDLAKRIGDSILLNTNVFALSNDDDPDPPSKRTRVETGANLNFQKSETTSNETANLETTATGKMAMFLGPFSRGDPVQTSSR